MKGNQETSSRSKSTGRSRFKYAQDSDEEDDLYLGTSDEERLDAMTEKDRQQILYERHSKLKAMKEREAIEQKVNDREKKVNISQESPSPKKKLIDNFDLLCRCITTRSFILDNIYKPFLKSFIGNIVRFKVETSYHIAKITNYVHGNDIYEITGLDNKKVKTDVLLELETGVKVYKRVKILFVSNALPSRSEYDLYVHNNPDFDFPAQKNTFEGLKYKMKKELTENEQIKTMSEKRSFYCDNNKRVILRKIKLIKERDEALDSKRYVKAEELQKAIDELSERMSNKDEDVWGAISERNRKINAAKAKLYETYKKNNHQNE